MIRIAGVVIPEDKLIQIALTYVYGIGDKRAMDICKELEFKCDLRVKDLSSDQILKLRTFIDTSYKIGGDLKAQIRADLRRLNDIECYRGLRHRKRLPCRGQRTHCNARSCRNRPV